MIHFTLQKTHQNNPQGDRLVIGSATLHSRLHYTGKKCQQSMTTLHYVFLRFTRRFHLTVIWLDCARQRVRIRLFYKDEEGPPCIILSATT